ncbi:Mitochondrial zinc maintenance protein 1, mitochondrial [Xylographa carneopallida]|nr:Mitochondrial zinc maintenance protein 1, mitochondrial [Xylographa carneopallida]
MALAAYRHVLRATRIAFSGDARLLLSARHQARSSFALNSALSASSAEATAQITHAEDVATILRQNVVQGQKVEGGGPDEKYQLRIHEETERGDNESIKMSREEMGSLAGLKRGIS